jgi:hypothetical protein
MLNNQTLTALNQMKLTGMAAAFAEQLQQPELQELSFEESFGLVVDREASVRENRRLTRLLQLARLGERACVEDINYTHPRGLDRSRLAPLLTCAWIREKHNLVKFGVRRPIEWQSQADFVAISICHKCAENVRTMRRCFRPC